ncbi:hypothetical protein HV127_18550 [Klebsiella sp. RHBSTW-00215]|uniref:hypothetical protein n=1 Tax=Klebsiella sp. RHBSTW-00215 TaxID=2742640 RepID=UPI0015F739DD|nr:hypothetical protein [Klebsiella sp. RHBSTW-00215]MBA7933221.1 hypothetical protein [Klebsiella sp. RHBSTW-00215]
MFNSHKKSSRPGALINHSLRLVSSADVDAGLFSRGRRLARTTGCDLVARTDAQHRLREMVLFCAMLPGAAQGACPGYGSTTVCRVRR